MPELRWILLLVGVGVIAGVYLWHRRSTREPDSIGDRPAVREEPRIAEPTISEHGLAKGSTPHIAQPIAVIPAADVGEPSTSQQPSAEKTRAKTSAPQPQALNLDLPEEPDAKEPQQQKIISLRIATRANEWLHAVDVVNALQQCGLEHGQYRIFHRFADHNNRELLFSIASLVEPGSFILDKLEEMNLPGLSVFMILPGPSDPVSAFSEMLSISRRLAEKLNCELLDDTGSTLSAQGASYLREDIIRFQHQLGLKS